MKIISNLSVPTLSNSLVLKYLVAGTQPNDKVKVPPYPEPIPFAELLINQSDEDLNAVLATGYGRDNEDLNLKRIEYGVDLDYLRDQDDPYYHALLVDAGYFLEHFKSHSDPRIRRLVAHHDPTWDTSQDPVYAVRNVRESVEQMTLHLGNQLHVAGRAEATYRPLTLTHPLPLAHPSWLVTYLQGAVVRPFYGQLTVRDDVWLLTAPNQAEVDFSTFTHYAVMPSHQSSLMRESFVLYSDQATWKDSHRHPHIAALPIGRPHVLEIPHFVGDLEILVDDTNKASTILLVRREQAGHHRLHADLSPEDVEYLTQRFQPILANKLAHD